jgi:hypothetical protein
MHADLSQGSRSVQSRRRLVRLLVLAAFGLFLVGLPPHLVHHLDEVSPACQLLALSVSLSSSSLDGGWLPSVDHTWNELVVPVPVPYISPPPGSSQARAPPAAIQT